MMWGKCEDFQQLYFSHVNYICFILQALRRKVKKKKKTYELLLIFVPMAIYGTAV